MRERHDAGRRRGADARQRDQRFVGFGKMPREVAHADVGGLLERERAAVVPHALPFLEQVDPGGCRQRIKGREPRHEAPPPREHACDLGLLQHDLGYPDRIRIGHIAPGKIAIQTRAFRTHLLAEGAKGCVVDAGRAVRRCGAPHRRGFLPCRKRSSSVMLA